MWVETMTGKKKDYVKIGFYGCDQKNQSFFFFFFSLTQTNVRSFNFFILFLGFDEIDKK